MTPGRDLNNLIAERVMGQEKGTKPVRDYSNKIEDAWEVATRLGISLIPVADHSWFAMVGPIGGFQSPADFIECMQKADFANSGAAVTKSAALSICIAAIKATEKRASDESAIEH
jgi:hypothetical protein